MPPNPALKTPKQSFGDLHSIAESEGMGTMSEAESLGKPFMSEEEKETHRRDLHTETEDEDHKLSLEDITAKQRPEEAVPHVPSLEELVVTKQTFYHMYTPQQIRKFLKPAIKKISPFFNPIVRLFDKTIRPLVEMFIYWEAIMDLSFLAWAILLTWYISTHGASLAWIGVVILFCAFGYKINYKRLRTKITAEVRRDLGKLKLTTDSETVEWMNLFLARFWLMFEPWLSETVSVAVNSVLEMYKPSFLYDLKLSTFTLGSEAPRIESVKIYPNTDDDILAMDWHVTFTPVSDKVIAQVEKRNSKIVLSAYVGKGMAVIPIPVEVSDCGMNAKFHIKLKFGKIFPHIKEVTACLRKLPQVDFTLKPLKGMDLLNLPLLNNFIIETMNSILSSVVVAPNKIHLDLEALMGMANEQDRPIGILRIDVYEARQLKNVDTFGLSDPFVKVYMGKKVVAKTKVIDDNLNPFWNQTFYIIVNASTIREADNGSDKLRVEVCDENRVKKDISLGYIDNIALANFVTIPEPPKKKEKDVKKTDGAKQQPAGQASSTTTPAPAPKSHIRRPSTDPKATLKDTQGEEEDLRPIEIQRDDWQRLSGGPGEGKNRGEIRYSTMYFPLPYSLDVSVKNDQELPSSGILNITIHQAKELDASKSISGKYNPFINILLNGQEVHTTKVKKRTNSPNYGETVTVFTTDIYNARLKFLVKDSRDLAVDPLVGETVISAYDILMAPEPKPEWFNLFSTKSGKIRVTVKYFPVDMFAMQGDDGMCDKVSSREALIEAGWSDQSKPLPTGVMRIGIVEAKDLKNVETLGKSDPYVRLRVNGTAKFKTHVRDNDLNPVWNETYYHITSSLSDRLEFEVFDSNQLAKDRPLGKVLCRAGEAKDGKMDGLVGSKLLEDNLTLDMWVGLKEDKDKTLIQGRGLLHFDTSFFPLLKIEKVKKATVAIPDSVGDLTNEDILEYDFSQYDCGIMRLKLFQARDLPKKADNIIAQVFLDGTKLVYQTTPRKKASDPHFEEDCEFFVTDTLNADICIRIIGNEIRTGVTAAASNPTATIVLGEWTCDVASILQERRGFKKSVWIPLRNGAKDDSKMSKSSSGNMLSKLVTAGIAPAAKDADVSDPSLASTASLEIIGKQGEVKVAFGFLPIDAGDHADTFHDQGNLQVDLKSAENLIAVDRGNTSDPYAVVYLNDNKIYKTAVHKKTLSPKFNESFTVPIPSRLRANLRIELRDYNKYEANKSLGVVNIPLNKIHPVGVMNKTTYVLDKVKSGTLKASIGFYPERFKNRRAAKEVNDGDFAEEKGTIGKLGQVLSGKKKLKATVTAITAVQSINSSPNSAVIESTENEGMSESGVKPKPSLPKLTVADIARLAVAEKRLADAEIGKDGSNASINSTAASRPGTPDGLQRVSKLQSVLSPILSAKALGNNELVSNEITSILNSEEGTLTIHVIEGRNLKVMDTDGLSSPFVKVFKDKKLVFKTHVRRKELSPTFMESFTMGHLGKLERESVVEFVVLDHRTFQKSSDMGSVVVMLWEDLVRYGKVEKVVVSPAAVVNETGMGAHQSLEEVVVSFDKMYSIVNGNGELHVSFMFRTSGRKGNEGISGINLVEDVKADADNERPKSRAGSLRKKMGL